MVDIGKIPLWGHALAKEPLCEAHINEHIFMAAYNISEDQLSSMALLNLKNFLTSILAFGC